jgi:cell division protein FtsI/penicillin-binding protein 2
MWGLDRNPVNGQRYAGENLTPFMQISAAIGEGGAIRISPMKTAQCYAALFAGTPLLVPSESGSARAMQELALSERTRRFLIGSLSRAVTDGTLKNINPGRRVRLIGGKTGTATQYRKKYAHHGWNALLFEYNGARFCLVSFVTSGSGAKEAAALSEAIFGALK